MSDLTFNEEVPPGNFLYKQLRDSANSPDMMVDGSTTAVDFEYTAPATGRIVVNTVIVHISDTGMSMDTFGGVAALTNGILIGIYDEFDTLIIDPLDGHLLKENSDWTMLAGVEDKISPGAVNDLLSVDWSITLTGRPLYLKPGCTFRVTVQDNLTALTKFHIMLQGLILTH